MSNTTDETYEQSLDNIYANLPKQAHGTGERFEIPKFELFAEGNKTYLKNFQVVCDKIRRDKTLLMKYLSKELAVPTDLQGERLILQRKINADIVNKKLEDFVTRYVVCKECKKPDTHIQELGHGIKQLICEACGARNSIRG